MLNQTLHQVGQMSRKMRRPVSHFRTRVSPFQISPFFIHPVLPGETLKKALIQARSISNPVKSDLIGWHAEMYFFYVKLVDLADDDKFRSMVVDPEYDPVAAGLTSTTDDPWTFFRTSAALPGINYVQKCLERVVGVFFRDDDELWNTYTIDGKPAARITADNVLNSLAPAAEYDAPDINVDLNADSVIEASEVEKARALWMMAMQQGLTDKTYEDWLRSYGMRVTKETINEPELVRYIRDWSYPTRLVEPSTGVPTAAFSWNIQEDISKDRFFKEPGFLFGVQVFRPKVYLKNYKGSITSYLRDGLSWLPGEVLNNVAFGMREFAASTGPVEDASATYMVDLRDLLMYGEQFANFDLATTTDGNFVALPNAACTNKEYVSLADVEGLFTTAANRYVQSDGIVSLHIAGHISGDLTPRA